MNFIGKFFTGILIGCGAILPGVSSGVFCVIFGIYEKLVNSIINFFKAPKKNFLFLFPICCGAFVGVIIFGNIIKYFFTQYKMQSCFAFIGLIIGTIPALLAQTSSYKCIHIKRITPLITSFLIGIILIFIENYFNIGTSVSFLVYNPFYLAFAGFIMSIGIVVPGISNTIILMCLGVYPQYISAIASVNLHILIPIGIGIVIGSILWLKLITILLHKYHESTYLCIIGFTLGSIFVLYPGISFDFSGIVSIILLIVSTFLSYKLSQYEHSA